LEVGIMLDEDHVSQARFGQPGAFEAELQKLRGRGLIYLRKLKKLKYEMLAYLRININIQLDRILNKTLDDSVILVFRILQKSFSIYQSQRFWTCFRRIIFMLLQ